MERRERADDLARALVLDTTHARDGLLDLGSALRAPPSVRSAKRLVHAGDVVVSRLRPYLRQIAFVHPHALQAVAKPIAVSSEFYVLAPRTEGEDLAFLVPFLLGERVQTILAAAQEGGHHPRVPRTSLLALRVPAEVLEQRASASEAVRRTQADVYAALERYGALFGPP